MEKLSNQILFDTEIIKAKKQVTGFPQLIYNISFIPAKWPRRDIGNSSNK